MGTIVFALTALTVTVVLLLQAARVVPTAHYGVVTRWGRRTGRILEEGLHFVIPFIDSVELFDCRLDRKVISLNFFSKDNREVIIKALAQWRPDMYIKNRDGRNRFVENKEETIIDGIAEAIKSTVGTIIGTNLASTFVQKKKAVERYINCVLRLSIPPHVDPKKTLKDETLPDKEIMGAAERLRFYEEHSGQINALLRNEKTNFDDHSEIEERYGIDIIAFEMGDVDFSLKTKEALEQKKRVADEMKAADILIGRIQKITAKLLKNNPGLNPEVAVNKALVVVGKADNKIWSIEGLGGLEKILGKIPGGKNA